MKKKLFLMIGLWLAMVVTIFAQTPDSALADALASLGLSKGVATVIVTLLAFVIGHFAIPQKWTSITALVQKILEVVIIALAWFNEKTNKLNPKQKVALDIEVTERKHLNVLKIIKVLVLGLFIGSIGLSVSAQGRWSGMLKPVSQDKIVMLKASSDGEGVSTGVFIPRWTASMTGTAMKYDTETKSVKSTSIARIGAGLSWAHYTPINDAPFNDYSFNALVLFPTEKDVNLGMAITVSALNFLGSFNINAGPMYDFVKGQSFKQNIGFLTGVTLVF